MFSPGAGKGGGSKGPGKNEGSPTQMEMGNVPIPPSTLEGSKVSKHKGLWQARKVLEVCLGLALEVVSMVPLAMVSDKVLVSLDPQ